MSDTATPTDAPPADDAPKTGRKWEGDFDEEKAKRLVDNLDAEIAELKATHATALAAVTAERDDFKAAAEKTGEDRDKALAEALKRAEEAERTLAISKHNLPEDVLEEFADYLTGTPAEVEAKAAKLAARLAPAPSSSDDPDGDKATDPDPKDAPPATPPARPRPDLKPGHGGEEPPVVDTAEIARKARQRSY